MLYITPIEYETGFLCRVEDVLTCEITHEINADYSLYFEVAINNKDILNIVKNNCVYVDFKNSSADYNKQYYIIYKTEEKSGIRQVYAKHISNELNKKVVLNIEGQRGVSSVDIFKEIIEKTEGFENINSSVLAEKGLTKCDVYTDFDEVSKGTSKSIIENLLNNISQGELYIDNNKIALVNELAESEEAYFFSEKKNIKNIQVNIDTTDLITRVYAFGKNGLDISSLGYNNIYLDSPNQYLYGIKEKILEYSNIDDVEMLLAKASWQFDEKNQNRIDKPAVSINFECIENGEDIHLGQKVILDVAELKETLDNSYRIVKISWYPFGEKMANISIGQVKKDLFYYFKKFNTADVNIVTNVVNNISNNNEFKGTIVEVTKENILAADMIEASAVFHKDIFTEHIETNRISYKCIPNIVGQQGQLKWENGEQTYTCLNSSKIRGYIKIEGISMKFIESHLIESASYTNIPTSDVEPLLIDGKPVYYTSINNEKNAYEYFTFVSPSEKYPNLSEDVKKMFQVMVRKVDKELIKLEHKFIMEDGTYNVITQYGAGDGTGRGIYQFKKDGESGELTYIGRNDGLKYGIRMDDTGLYLLNGQHTATVVPPTHFIENLDENNLIEGHLYFVKGGL